MSKFEKDLSKGSVWKQLILFSLPFLFSNLIQSLYSVADMIIVGQFADTAAMSGVNIGGQVTMLITNMVFGLSAASTVLIGQYMGAGDKKAIKETIGTLFTVLTGLAVVLTVVMLLLTEPLLHLIQTPEGSFQDAKDYFFITMLGTFFIFGYNAIAAVLRGMGDSKNPLYFVIVACVVNVALDLLFVGPMEMGAMGAALATVIAQGVSMLLSVFYLKRNNFVFSFAWSAFRVQRERLRLILKIGVPTSIQNIATSVSFLVLTALVNTIYTGDMAVVASAAVGAVGKFNSFGILPALAMSMAVSAMAAQNLGAGRVDRASRTVKVGVAVSFAISLLVFAFAQLAPETVMRIFGDDAAMIEEGVKYLRSFSFDYLIVPFVFCLNGLFNGAGHTNFSLVNNALSALIIRIPASWFFGKVMEYGLFGVGLGAPLASAMAMLLGGWYFFSKRWTKQRILHNKAAAE